MSFAGHVFTVGFEGLEGALSDFVDLEDDGAKAERLEYFGFFADADHVAEGRYGFFAGEVREGEGVVSSEDEGVAFVGNVVGSDEVAMDQVSEPVFHFRGGEFDGGAKVVFGDPAVVFHHPFKDVKDTYFVFMEGFDDVCIDRH